MKANVPYLTAMSPTVLSLPLGRSWWAAGSRTTRPTFVYLIGGVHY